MPNTLSQYWREQTSLGYAIAGSDPRAARTNIRLALTLIMLFNVSMLIALLAWSLWPLVFGLLFFASLVQRHALQNRNKSLRIRTRFLYGIEAYLSQIPIFIGQLNYRTRSLFR